MRRRSGTELIALVWAEMKLPKRRTGASISRILVSTALVPLTASALATTGIDFDDAFNDRNEPAQLYYRATYNLYGSSDHQVEVWRDRNLNLKRRTDDAIQTYVFRSPGEDEWKMVVLDSKRKIRTDIDRTSLFRIGHFTDWFSLAHSLTRPIGPYELVALRGAAPGAAPIAACRWYLLTQRERSSKVCWSTAWHIALLITDRENNIQWKITEIRSSPLTADIFRIDDLGFVRNDATEDIKAD